MSQDDVIVVFTDESIERIIRKGGTSAWRLKPNHARRCPYVFCTRNVNGNGEKGPEEHYTGFLLAKVKGVVSTHGPFEGERYVVQISEFARVNMPDAWPKGIRNPVRYSSLEETGIDPSKLEWEPMPESGEAGDAREQSQHAAGAPLTLVEAKKGLALTFGVAPEAIEITIRA